MGVAGFLIKFILGAVVLVALVVFISWLVKNKIKHKIQNRFGTSKSGSKLPPLQQWVPDIELAQPQKVLLAGEPQVVGVVAQGEKSWQPVAVWNH